MPRNATKIRARLFKGALQNFCLPSIFVWSFAQASAQSQDQAQNQPQDLSAQSISTLRLQVKFDPQFVTRSQADKGDLENICEAFAGALKPGRGPWGFGIFERTGGCEVDGAREANADFATWTLRIETTLEQLTEVKLCRPMPSQSEKCEASVVVPAKVYLKELLQHQEFVKILLVGKSTPFLI